MASSEAKSPKAIIHQRVLQVAESKPNASLDEIASNVSGATVDLVERVFDEYGDPVEPPQKPIAGRAEPSSKEAVPSPGEATSAEAKEHPAWEDLSSKVQETLLEVYHRPEVTQQEIADRLGVCGPTVSNRLSKLEGFNWAEREVFVAKLPEPDFQSNTGSPDGNDMTELKPPAADEVPTTPSTADQKSQLSEPELVHKVIRVCMDSGEFTKEEEIELIARLT